MDYAITSGALDRTKILELVTVDSVKLSERISHNVENEMIADDIVAAYEYLNGMEGWTNGYYMLEEEVEIYTSGLETTFEIPLRPIRDMSGVTFGRLQADGTYADVAAADYAAGFANQCLVLSSLSRTAFKPGPGTPHPRSYRVTATVGTESALVPAGLVKSIRLLAGHYYMNREAAFADTRTGQLSRKIAYGVEALAGRYRFSPDHS